MSVRRIGAVLHGDRSDRFTQEMLQGAPPRAARSSAFVCWPVKGVYTNWRLRWGTPKNKIMMLVGQNIQNTQDLLQDNNSMIGIGNRIIVLIQCRFPHIDHLYLCRMGLIFTCHILVHRGLIILGCRLLIVILVKIMLFIEIR